MDFNLVDEKHKNVPLLTMKDNNNGNLLFYIRKYNNSSIKAELHQHDYVQINYVLSGHGSHAINNQKFDIVKGDIFIIPPYVPHQILSVSDLNIELIEFEFEPEFINLNLSSVENIESFYDFAYIEPFLVSESHVKPRLNISGQLQLEVERILNTVLNEYKEKLVGFDLLAKALLLNLLVIVGREFSGKIETDNQSLVYDRHKCSILMALRYIDEHYMEDLTIDFIASKALLSKSYFCYFFKVVTGQTFVEYLNSLRISHAMTFLKRTNNKVLDICYMTGFKNISHFNRLFKHATGLSPTAYRKLEKQAI